MSESKNLTKQSHSFVIEGIQQKLYKMEVVHSYTWLSVEKTINRMKNIAKCFFCVYSYITQRNLN